MRIAVSRSELLDALTIARRTVDGKSPTPILANVLLSADGALRIAATDLEVSFSALLTAHGSTAGGVAVHAATLLGIVKRLPDGEVVLAAEGGRLQIRSAKSEFRIVGLPDKDFPKLPDHREVSFGAVDRSLFGDLIDKTLFSVSTDETRYHLSGALLEADGAVIRMVSTDGHRLSVAEAARANGLVIRPLIIPAKGLAVIRHAIGDLGDGGALYLGVSPQHVHLRYGGAVLSVKLIDAKFPPYDQVIPRTADKAVELGRAALTDSLRRVSLLSVEKTNGVRFELKKGVLRITADNPDLGEAREELDVDYGGSPLTIGFNARYMLEVLAEVSADRVVLELNGELDPGVLRPADGRHYLGVVMPMRI